MTTFWETVRELRSSQKSNKGVSLYSRFVNRPLGRVLAALAFRAGLSPNQVTAASALATAGGIAILVAAPPTPALGFAAAALFVLGFALDSADGQLARLSARSSPAGEWLDHVVDAAKTVAVHSAVLIGIWRFADVATPWLLVPLGFLLVGVVTFSGLTIAELIRRTLPAEKRADRGPASLVRSIALLPADFGVLALSFLLWGFTTVFLIGYTALFAVNAAIMAALLVKWFRELSVR